MVNYVGAAAISGAKFGSESVSSLYLGNTKVYSAAEPPSFDLVGGDAYDVFRYVNLFTAAGIVGSPYTTILVDRLPPNQSSGTWIPMVSTTPTYYQNGGLPAIQFGANITANPAQNLGSQGYSAGSTMRVRVTFTNSDGTFSDEVTLNIFEFEA